MLNTFAPLVIPALIARHAEDAAFYWSRLDAGAQGYGLSIERLFHFDQLLEAHLEGLVVAGPDAVEPALKALDRWRKPGEAFVCMWLLAHHPDESSISAFTGKLKSAPDTLLRGAISAMARLPSALAEPLLKRWFSTEAHPVEQVLALRALALSPPGQAPHQHLQFADFLRSTCPQVRAAACRCVGRSPVVDAAVLMKACLDDGDLAVRAEAAIALSSTAYPGEAGAVLWQCVAAKARLHQTSTGATRKMAERRLNRWVRHLAWLAPFGHADLPALFDHLPPRQALSFALYHGDAAHLARVVAAMSDTNVSRYAGWVWQAMTGVDLRANGLALSEPEIDPMAPPSDNQRDADMGLLLPDAQAVLNANVRLPLGQRILLGQALTPVLALQLLNQHVQALRVIAAHALGQLAPAWAPQVQASGREQQRQVHMLAARLEP